MLVSVEGRGESVYGLEKVGRNGVLASFFLLGKLMGRKVMF